LDKTLEESLREVYKHYYKRPEPRADVAVDIHSPPVTIIRISIPIRFLWVCRRGHDHRWRLGAWFCNLKG
jgi:hypothetical protein